MGDRSRALELAASVLLPRLKACIRAGIALFPVVAFSACAAHYASQRLGSAGAADPRVAVFNADRETSWSQFRLGGGLDVVVANPHVPREFAWRVQTGGISSSPTVLGTTILVSANDDHLYAIDAASGALRWRYRAENEIMSQPGYRNGLIYVGVGNSETSAYYPPHFSLVGTGISKVEAIRASDGVEAWWGGLDGSGMPSQAIVSGTIVSVDGNGTVLALDLLAGTYRWHVEFPTSAAMSSVADDGAGHIYFAGRAENAVYALRDTDGSLLWTHHFDQYDGGTGDDPIAQFGRMLVGDYLSPVAPGPYGTVVTFGSRAHEHVFALDKVSGRILWDTSLPSASGRVPPYNEASIELVYGDRVFVGSPVAPIVTALDLRGRVLWQARVHGAVKGGIAARDGVLYFGDHSGCLWALSADTGRTLGTIQTDMSFNVGSAIIVNDSLVIGGTEDVLAVPLANIRQSKPVGGVTALTAFEKLGRFFAGLIPRRDPHREAGYYR